MTQVIGGKVLVAPNGETKVRVFPHGYVEFVSNETDEAKELIQEMSQASAEMLGREAPAVEVFKNMGWIEA